MRPHDRRRWNRSTGGPVPPQIQILIALLVIGLVAGLAYRRSIRSARSDAFTAATGSVLRPVQGGTAGVADTASGWWSALFRGPERERENAALRSEVARLRLENESLKADADQASRLQEILGFIGERRPAPTVTAVIAWLPNPFNDTLTLAAGSRHGISKQQAVRTDTGLVGKIVEIGPFSSRVRLLSDVDSRVSAKIVRDGKLVGQGILFGEGRDLPVALRNVKPESDVRPGDQVVTFGDGGVFPPDIPIGTVSDVTLSASRVEKVAHLALSAPPPGDLREVLVLAPSASEAPATPPKKKKPAR